MEKYYTPTKQTLKKNILKFLQEDYKKDGYKEDSLVLVDFNTNDEDDENDVWQTSEAFYIGKITEDGNFPFCDYEEYFLDEGLDRSEVLLLIVEFGYERFLTKKDLEDVKGKTINHKIANYLIKIVYDE